MPSTRKTTILDYNCKLLLLKHKKLRKLWQGVWAVTSNRRVRNKKKMVCNSEEHGLCQPTAGGWAVSSSDQRNVSKFQETTPVSQRTRICSLSAQIRYSCNHSMFCFSWWNTIQLRGGRRTGKETSIMYSCWIKHPLAKIWGSHSSASQKSPSRHGKRWSTTYREVRTGTGVLNECTA